MIEIMPVTGRISPFRASSPTNELLFRFDCKSCLESARMPNAIGKSSAVLAFRNWAGAKFTTILRLGKVNWELVIAERMRSRLSEILLSAMPMIVKLGSPWFASQSTEMRRPSAP